MFLKISSTVLINVTLDLVKSNSGDHDSDLPNVVDDHLSNPDDSSKTWDAGKY
jgi:hypothetical protein